MEAREIDLSGASLEQLDVLKRQTENDIKNLGSNLSTLRVAQGRFADSASALSSIPLDAAGGEILVPLTSSLYVPGKIAASTEVLVDIGTGFYVGKAPKDAAEIMSKKSEMVRKQADQLGKVINVKQSNMEIINNFIEHKHQEGRSGGDE